MVERVSALNGYYSKGSGGADGGDVCFRENPDVSLIQLAAWPETLSTVGAKAAALIGAGEAPGPGKVVTTSKGTLMRIEPLKWWLVGASAVELPLRLSSDEGAVLDLSHSRTHLSISGPQAAILLNRHLPLDLREAEFPVGTVASSAFHHTGVTVWRSDQGFELLMIRGFALSLWQLLLESGEQFNADVV